MCLFGGDFIEAIRAKMAVASQRQAIIAKNIANASTPDFLPSDLNEAKFLAHLRREAQSSSAAAGGNSSGPLGAGSRRFVDTLADGETTPNGNGVNLERQMMKAAENSMEYQQAASLYRKAMTMWRTALGGRGA